MKKIILGLALCAGVLLSQNVYAQNQLPDNPNPSISEAMPASSSPLAGYWLTENKRSVIKVEECMKGLCGTIHWIIEGGMQYDSKNPDEAKRNTPMCGLPILWGFEKESETEWENGNIYKADEGDVYSSEMELQKDGTLKVRGYIGVSFLGKSQVWTRVSADEYPACSAAK